MFKGSGVLVRRAGLLAGFALLAGAVLSVSHAPAYGDTQDCTEVCGLGRTMGFWQSPPGRNLLSGHYTDWADELNALCLVDGSGNDYDVPTGGTHNDAHADFRTWLLGANATNMAYMLSGQLAAFTLNVHFGPMSAYDDLQVFDLGNNLVSVHNLIAQANALLCADPVTVSSGTARTNQENMNNLLDALNNNTVCVWDCDDTTQEPPPPPTTIVAFKYYDFNADGNFDDNCDETPIEGWEIYLISKTSNQIVDAGETDADGFVTFIVPTNDEQYWVVEYPEWPWIATTDTEVCVTANGGTKNVEFGNVLMEERAGLGLTPGFWQSPPGRNTLAQCGDWWDELNDLCLVWPNGTDFMISGTSNGTAHAELRSWLNAPSGSNMAHILGRQFAALFLNVHCGPMSESALVYVIYNDEPTDLEDLFELACDLICKNPNSTSGNKDWRDEQEDLKNFFDAINNNEEGFSVWMIAPNPYSTCTE
jgi:hypothetical protein